MEENRAIVPYRKIRFRHQSLFSYCYSILII